MDADALVFLAKVLNDNLIDAFKARGSITKVPWLQQFGKTAYKHTG